MTDFIYQIINVYTFKNEETDKVHVSFNVLEVDTHFSVSLYLSNIWSNISTKETAMKLIFLKFIIIATWQPPRGTTSLCARLPVIQLYVSRCKNSKLEMPHLTTMSWWRSLGCLIGASCSIIRVYTSAVTRKPARQHQDFHTARRICSFNS